MGIRTSMHKWTLGAALGAIMAFSTPVAFSDTKHVGQVSWDSGVVSFTEARCGLRKDFFIMTARNDTAWLRLEFKGASTVDSVDFSDPIVITIFFNKEHPLSRSSFARYKAMGEMGEIDASTEGAAGQIHLRPASPQGLDNKPDGMTITYDFRCTGELR